MKYYKKIDGLRFVALTLVLIWHFAGYIGRFINAGWVGVDLFFVISGFLITTILLKPSDKPFWRLYKTFVGRRTLRIFPVYYLLILILIFLQDPTTIKYLVYLLTYTFNYAICKYEIKTSNPIGHFWSLCVEEQFYLIWPFIVLNIRKRTTFLLIIIISVILIGYMQLTFGIISSLNKYNGYGLLTRMGSLGFGAIAALLVERDLIPIKVLKSGILEYVIFSVYIISMTTTFTGSLFVMTFCSFYIVLKAVYIDFHICWINKFLSNKYIIKVGRLSYGIYLFHIPIGFFVMPLLFDPIWNSINFKVLGPIKILKWHAYIIKLPITFAISYFAAYVSFRFFEKPFLTVRNRMNS